MNDQPLAEQLRDAWAWGFNTGATYGRDVGLWLAEYELDTPPSMLPPFPEQPANPYEGPA